MNQVSTSDKLPKTKRGQKTREKLLQAAELEFGEKGFHDASISEITRRAGVALGTFYTYFGSKEEIFRALVSYMSHRTRRWIAERIDPATDRLSEERLGAEAYIEFVRQHRWIYRIVGEAEFVANEAYREHYQGLLTAYENRLRKAAEQGEIREGDYEVWSWAILGINLFMGMRYAEWDNNESPARIAEIVGDLIANGIGKKHGVV